MSKTFVVQYRTRPDAADENRRLIEQVFAQLAAEEPANVRYTALQLGDGVSFVHVVVVDEGPNPLPGLSSFTEFAKGIGERCDDEPPTPAEAEVIGSYRLFAD